MKKSIGPIALAPGKRPWSAAPVPDVQSFQPAHSADERALLDVIHRRGDRWMGRFMVVHLLIAFALAPFHDTWMAAAGIGGAAALAFFVAAWLWPGQLVTRMVAGVSLQAFCALHIFQMAGLAEMHFFFFTAVTALVIYQDWRAPWPGVLAIIIQHSVFHHLHNEGIHPGGLPFFEPEYVSPLRMSFHYGIAIAHVAIASYWAHELRQQTLRDASQRTALEQMNSVLREQQLELEIANEHLQESAIQLEEANEELRESEQRFRSTFDQAAVGVAHVGLDGSWLRVNDRLCEIVGYPREELLRCGFPDVTHPEDLERGVQSVQRVLAGEIATYSMEQRYLRKNGSPVWVQLTVSLVSHPTGGPRYFISVIEDIHARKQAEAERDLLHEREAEARREAEAANRAKMEFLSAMSHELRTPLNAIIGFTELLETGVHGPVSDTQAADLARIRSASRYLLSLINDVLNFARIEAGRVELTLTDVSINDVLSEAEALVTPQMDAKQIQFSTECSEPDAVTPADGEKVQQILLNLLTNACKFTDRGGWVRLTCTEDGNTLRAQVADSGRGISADRLESIFEPFVQVDRHLLHDSQQGVGLGLAISRQLARAMGGDLTADSVPGSGSTFTLSLPVRERDGGTERRIGDDRRSGEDRREAEPDGLIPA